MSATLKGPWNEEQVASFLETAVIPMRLAAVGKDGFPRVVSVWFCYLDGELLCASHSGSPLVSLLRNNPRAGFEIAPNEPPYHGVRGQGTVVMSPEGAGATLEHLIQRYLGNADSGLAQWLLSRKDEELLISLRPERVFSWDYRERMSEE
ncbi:MAG: pyridoxamine 5'-phosphate oxidase family protein [Halieaceae bacterium]